MAFAYFDRVKETSSTTGTGSITLAGAVSQFRSFQSVYATNDTMYYTIADQSGTNWEVGLGTLTGATTLARSTVLASSNAGALVNFTSASLFVFTTIPAVALAFSPLGTLLFSNTSLPGGNTVANTAAETAFTSSYTIAANTMNQGDVFRIRLYGVYGTLVTPTTLEIKVKFGSTIMLDTGAFTDTGSLTNDGWMLEGYFIVQSIGASGAIETQGYSQFMTAATVGAAVPLTNTATKTIDTTTTQAVTATAQWGSASASNTITLRLMTLEKMTTAAGPVVAITNSDGTIAATPSSGNVVLSTPTGGIKRVNLNADAKGWIFLGSATGATTTVGPVIWTATVQQLMIKYWIAGYNGGTPVGRILLGSASISTTALTNSFTLSEGITAPTNASGASAVPGCPLAVTLSAIGRSGTIFVDGASGSIKSLDIIGRNVTPSIASAPTLFRGSSFFSDLGTNLNLLRAQLTVYDTLATTAASAQAFISGTYLAIWGRNTD